MSNAMAKYSKIPPFHRMMWPTLLALKELGNSGSNQEINDKAIAQMNLTESQLEAIHVNGPLTEVAYRLHWARSYLKAAGAITNTRRGIWSITQYGQSVSETEVDKFPKLVRSRMPKSTRDTNEAPTKIEETGEDEKSTNFASTDTEEWHSALLKILLELSPATFEGLCQRMLREAEFTKVEVTGRSGDGGIDGVGVLRVSLLSFQVFFQCKRYRGSVGAAAIRDFRGAMVGRTDKGLLITTGTFTPDAKREATRDGAPVLDLIDGDAFCDLLKKLNLGISTQQVEEVTILRDWFTALA